ncbi:MAG: hypothetical protein RLZZ175_1180 [Bacteroidota bacterium]|jgi:hypothetical protein
MKNNNIFIARVFGISFLIGYLSYGLGFGFLNTLLQAKDFLLAIFQSKNIVIVEAAIMMAIFAPINIVLGVVMTPIFKRHNQSLAYGYLSSAIASTVLLIVGAILLLMLIPLSEEYISTSVIDKKYFELLGKILKQGNFYSYQIAMVVWGIGGLIFSYLLLISQIVPKWLSIWGIIGYIIFISGAFFALFGISIDVILDIPGGLFEIFLSIRFIIKGFDMPINQTDK